MILTKNGVLGLGLALTALVLGAEAAPPSATAGDPLRVYAEGEQLRDGRLGSLRTLNAQFPFTSVSTPEEWAERAEALRRRIRVATGLWPMPTRAPLRAVVHGRVDRPEYTVEKVYFESLPGHFVTGNLYRPEGPPGRRCAVLSPHGHTGSDATRRDGGRVHDVGPEAVRGEIAAGAERFEVGGRYPLQARGVQLARMGCVVFQYDMVGYADSLQLAHKGLGVRPHLNTPERWGFSSPQADLHLQSLMGLQTWNSVRALDFLLSLPDVDPERVAVEGHSGGGTQTFVLAAIDDRPRVLFPAVMVSTGMQGGCLCENASHLRVGAGNVDIAALAAPRPLGMTGADDWTLEIEEKGLPDLENLYALLGAEGLVAARTFPQFGHNYNSVSRTVMYGWLNRHLDLGFPEPVLERDYPPLSREEASVWNAEHPAPHGDQVGDAHERAVLEWMTRDAEGQLEQLDPVDAAHLERFREVVGGAFDVILARRLDDVGDVSFEPTNTRPVDGGTLRLGLLRHEERGEELPAALLEPREEWNQEVVIWIHEDGWRGLFETTPEPVSDVRRLLRAGFAVAGVDLLLQGELRNPNLDPTIGRIRARRVCRADCSQGWHRAGVFTSGYNPALFARRVHDVLTAVHHFQDRGARVTLVGLGPVAGPLAVAARAQSGEALARAAVDTGGFRFAALERLDDPMLLPGAAKYLDLPGLLVLGAGGELWLGGEGDAAPALVAHAYRAQGRTDDLHVHAGPAGAADVVDWLIEE
jgi:dienelactone hydrolase